MTRSVKPTVNAQRYVISVIYEKENQKIFTFQKHLYFLTSVTKELLQITFFYELIAAAWIHFRSIQISCVLNINSSVNFWLPKIIEYGKGINISQGVLK